MELFGEVRSILQQRPKRRSWERLVALLARVDEQRLSEHFVPYCLDHFARSQDWYYYKREAPEAWVKPFAEHGRCGPQLALVSHLELKAHTSAYTLPEPMTLMERLQQAQALANLRVLSLERLNLSDAHILRLVQATNLQRLEALHLGENHYTKTGVLSLLTAKDRLASLELLDLRHTRLGPEVVDTIIERLELPKLAWLNLEGCGLDKASVAKLEAAQALPSTIRLGWGKL